MSSTSPSQARLSIGWADTLRVLLPYVKRNFMAQVNGIWFIVAYLLFFQLFILKLPIVYASMITVGIGLVAVGLMFFMEGLRLGLMPLGEVIGGTLPSRRGLGIVCLFALLLGVGATFAEPAIAVLKAAGSTVSAADAPLLYSLLNEFADQLVMAVGAGVGVAVLLGVLRFFVAVPLKLLAIPSVLLLLGLSFIFHRNPILSDVLGLAWDCGAVTTGPVTVPLVLALGIGVCRVVSTGQSGSHSGFGIVTLASLFPILSVLLLGGYHYSAETYRGAQNGLPMPVVQQAEVVTPTTEQAAISGLTRWDLETYLRTGELPADTEFEFSGGTPSLQGGALVISSPEIRVYREQRPEGGWISQPHWQSGKSFAEQVKGAAIDAARAIIPLCLFLYLVLRFVVRDRLPKNNDIGLGVLFALLGMGIFGLGITLGLTPLGGQLGANIPASFAAIMPWGSTLQTGPLFGELTGKLVAVAFAFFLGYGATLAEPALNALGETVERVTAGAFRKPLLMQSVAAGVGIGIAAGVVKMVFGLPLFGMLLPAYSLALLLTCIAPNSYVNFAWDSAGVTTGPITVPLVMAMGLGVGANIPSVSDGFGILALASVGPILTVLSVGLVTHARQNAFEVDASADDSADALQAAQTVEA
ncbi:MAG: DUF1538 domain-containing protein [Pseudomonadota bacterium]